jgi:hypothetical protein
MPCSVCSARSAPAFSSVTSISVLDLPRPDLIQRLSKKLARSNGLFSSQPFIQMFLDESVIVQIRISSADTINFLHLSQA